MVNSKNTVIPQEGRRSDAESLALLRARPTYLGGPRTTTPTTNANDSMDRSCTKMNTQANPTETEPAKMTTHASNPEFEPTNATMTTASSTDTRPILVGQIGADEMSSDMEVSSRSEASTPTSKFFRKRKMQSDDSGSDGGSLRSSKISAARRGRGRPSSSGEVQIGKTMARIEATRAKTQVARETARLSAEKEIQELTRRSFMKDAPGPSHIHGTGTNITAAVQNSIAAIELVAKSSGNLKGTFVRALKDAAKTIKEAVEELADLSVSENSKRLEADNARLQRELAAMREDMAAIRKELSEARRGVPLNAPSTAPVNTPGFDHEEFARSIMVQVGTMVNARFEGLNDRLLPEKRLRPPLAADKRKDAAQKSYAAVAAPPKKIPVSAIPPATAGEQQQQRKGKGRGKKTGTKNEKGTAVSSIPAIPAPAAQISANPIPSTSAAEEWTVVSKRKKQKKKSRSQRSQKNKKKAAARLRPPRSAAVVITLQPAAEEGGTSYAHILAEAKTKIDLAGLGIPNLRIRQAATGARILEVPGVSSGEKADLLAESLRSALPLDTVRVSRPIKCAELRISGLDDSVTSAEVVAAVAKASGGDTAAIQCGEVRSGANGLGVVWLRCPVAEAKKLADIGKILVGWVSARVTLLDSKPLRCYRCLEVGHTRAKCGADVDRSGECYRCGRTGHRASQCGEAPHCTLCAAIKRPADHRLGSRACGANTRRKGTNKPQTPKAPGDIGKAKNAPEVVAVRMEQ